MDQVDADHKTPQKCTTRIRPAHIAHCIFMFLFLSFSVYTELQGSKSVEDGGTRNRIVTALVYILRLQNVLFMFPIIVLMVLGVFLYDAFPGDVPLKGSPAKAPFICFRTVTRGDFPELIRENVRRNLETCRKTGLVNFVIEVVTDKAVNVPESNLVKELVVPSSYRTKNGAQYKARALQYCLEDDVNKLSDRDWIVHLDEESLLTENSVRGIVNFVLDGKHQFGQGLITYANEKIVNWLTTCADCFRVGDDMGKLRFTLKVFHRPIVGWKGSFMVCLAGAERKVSFDHGLEGSITEDVFFALMAFKQGYSFDFIDGEMWEKSPFTVLDFARQRKRWITGALSIIMRSAIPMRYKFCYIVYFFNYLAFPLNVLDAVLEVMFRPTISPWLMFFFAITRGGFTYMYLYGGMKSLYGGMKSFSLKRLEVVKFVVCILAVWCSFIFFIAMEAVVAIWVLLDQTMDFHIVDKRISSTT